MYKLYEYVFSLLSYKCLEQYQCLALQEKYIFSFLGNCQTIFL